MCKRSRADRCGSRSLTDGSLPDGPEGIRALEIPSDGRAQAGFQCDARSEGTFPLDFRTVDRVTAIVHSMRTRWMFSHSERPPML